MPISRRSLLAAAASAPLAGLLRQTLAAPAAQGVYVAVGYGGRRMMSRDGLAWDAVQQWTDKNADDSNNLISVAFGKGKFVAVGGGGFSKETQAGHVLVSADGKDWREVKKYPFRVSPVVFAADRFVAGGPSRQLLWSDDGEAWTEGPAVPLPKEIPSWAFWFRHGAAGIVGGKPAYVFVGNANKDQKTWWCLTSRDGKAVASFATDLPKVAGIAFGAGRFVIASPEGLRTSPDGQKWEAPADGPQDDFRGVVWTGTAFYATGKQQAYTSPDGRKWSPAGKAPGAHVLWADERVMIGSGWPGKMSASTDGGKTWKPTGQPMPGLGVNAVAYGVPGK
ncbi:MAG TPA: hypothetical protein VF796_24930 [Humisphaera sp.]